MLDNWSQLMDFQREPQQLTYSHEQNLYYSITVPFRIKYRIISFQSPSFRAITRGRVEAVRRGIEDRFNLGDQLDIRTKRVTTNNVFEVIVEDFHVWRLYLHIIRQISVCGRLVHSRKRGDGLVDTVGKMNTILRYVESIISNDAWDCFPLRNSRYDELSDKAFLDNFEDDTWGK